MKEESEKLMLFVAELNQIKHDQLIIINEYRNQFQSQQQKFAEYITQQRASQFKISELADQSGILCELCIQKVNEYREEERDNPCSLEVDKIIKVDGPLKSNSFYESSRVSNMLDDSFVVDINAGRSFSNEEPFKEF